VRHLPALLIVASCGERRAAAPPAVEEDAAAAIAEAVPASPPPPLAALDAARLDALAAVEVPGLAVVQRDRTETSLVVAFTGEALRGLATVGPCVRCLPIDLAAWRAIEPELRALMPGAVEEEPETRFELAIAEVAGRPCVASWELGAASYGDELDAAHGARIYCNDGTVELVVRVDDAAIAAARTVDEARGAAARRDAVEATARRIAEAYLAAL
jgi:hypothetical protein